MTDNNTNDPFYIPKEIQILLDNNYYDLLEFNVAIPENLGILYPKEL